MLTEDMKQEIQQAYSALLTSLGYTARYCQRRMIADIANTLGNIEVGDAGERVSENHICVVEAGTGTGKTVAYAVAALPLARALGKRLVIATATVALQEQIVLRDLPDISVRTGLDFTFSLAKGRRRYLCLSRLDQALSTGASANQSLFYADEMFGDDAAQLALFEAMLERLGRAEWDGDRDAWPEAIDDRVWARVSTDHIQCTNRKCSHFQNCYFYRARETIHKVDCVVTNQDLVLADLMMGGGAVLPPPEDTIYIFDEGHHLPDKAINHFSSFFQLRSTQTWLEQLPVSVSQLVDEIANLRIDQPAFEDDVATAVASLSQCGVLLEPYRAEADADGEDFRYRFVRGRVDPELKAFAGDIVGQFARLQARVVPLVDILEEKLSEPDDPGREELEQWLPVVAAMGARLQGALGLWQDFAREDRDAGPPYARWITFRGIDEVVLSASPVDIHEILDEMLWSRCFGAVVTSATLAVAGDFERFRSRSGIGPQNRFSTLASPFRFREQATLCVPAMDTDPRNAEAHTAEVAEQLPRHLHDAKGALVLFASWRQMYRVTELVDEQFRERVLAQGNLSKAEIVAQHKARIDAGAQSIIFGLASFAEGIDLPGDYCDHVVIVKIPFAVPDDPVGATLSEWIESNGGNAFSQIMVPDAAIRMVQACGRLLRTETDHGRITVLDRRLVTQRYGALLLDALPPYAREIG